MSFAIRAPRVKTLRGRLTLWYLAMLALSLGLFAALLYAWLSYVFYQHHDDELALEAGRLSRLLASAPRSPEAVDAVLRTAPTGGRFVLLRDTRGDVVHQSAALSWREPNIGRHQVFVHAAARHPSEPEYFSADLEQSGPVRFICLPVGTPAFAYLQVGVMLGDVKASLDSVMLLSAMLIPIVVILTSFGGLLLARRALRPIEEMDTTLQAIQASDLGRRLDVHGADEELAGHVKTINQLLDRLERAFAGLREFVSDASHQLQTPLAIMRGTLDVACAAPREMRSDERRFASLTNDVQEMTRLVSDLRALTLADAGPAAAAELPVDLSEVCLEVGEIATALGEADAIQVEVAVEPDIAVWGELLKLKHAVLNLCDNAIKYTQPGGQVRVHLAGGAGVAVLRVSDTGPGIAVEHHARIFDRFYRVPTTRHVASGTGLGLAIVQRIVQTHGGTVAVESRLGAGSTFTLTLPLAAIEPSRDAR